MDRSVGRHDIEKEFSLFRLTDFPPHRHVRDNSPPVLGIDCSGRHAFVTAITVLHVGRVAANELLLVHPHRERHLPGWFRDAMNSRRAPGNPQSHKQYRPSSHPPIVPEGGPHVLSFFDKPSALSTLPGFALHVVRRWFRPALDIPDS